MNYWLSSLSLVSLFHLGKKTIVEDLFFDFSAPFLILLALTELCQMLNIELGLDIQYERAKIPSYYFKNLFQSPFETPQYLYSVTSSHTKEHSVESPTLDADAGNI